MAADWTGGLYASVSLPGSRVGSQIATTWAALLFNGNANYKAMSRKIKNKTIDFAEKIYLVHYRNLRPRKKNRKYPFMCFAAESWVDAWAKANTLSRKRRKHSKHDMQQNHPVLFRPAFNKQVVRRH